MAAPSVELLRQIDDTLHRIPEDGFFQAASDLLSILGYRSDRIPPEQTGKAADFIKQFPTENRNTTSEQLFLEHDPTVRILFQITDAEIEFPFQQPLPGQLFNIGVNRSFVFAAVDLKKKTYPRGMYAKLAREINKRLSQPTVVLFRTATGMLTIAFMDRRPDKRTGNRDVLGKVSLIREINSKEPHQAHLRILGELSLHNRLEWMQATNNRANFDGLLTAWINCLDTEKLNKQFYRELFRWFENAADDQANFPTSVKPTTEEHIIRLITRLLFIWFIKEKGLVNADLFNEAVVGDLLADYDQETGDSYYRAILQNLFFATLNTEIEQRGFSDNNPNGNFSLYRYQDEIADPDRLLSLFAETPFINGGLFDCLDRSHPTNGQGLIDCFSDNPDHRGLLSVPNRLFFGSEGLIPLFDRYRFTVEENTPVEQDVALDPELLGKVFENLLAAFNPETRVTARRQTGSYYTPRQVVDYMVTEALVAYWTETVQDNFDDKDFWEERLRYLLDYSDDIDDARTLLMTSEQDRLIENIAHIRVLDPAVGSGAFPMAILHRITLALSRLDPDNTAWRETQQRLAGSRAGQAFGIEDKDERHRVLQAINEAFERYQSGFGRKLYLIQNSIYGVDIQPIACQIAKLRMFISLAIEQQPNSDPEDNYGIRPLPNLESRFVAADSLIGLKGQERLASPRAVDLRRKWAANTERHFHATTPQKKAALVREDRKLRTALAKELRHLGMSPDHTDSIAKWDRYNQNTSADWFDPKYMFDLTEGFDIVIGNPPYIESRNSLMTAKKKDAYGNQVRLDWAAPLPRGSDILIYFYARAAKFLRDTGCGCFITQNAWLSTDYGKKFQDFSLERFAFHHIIDTSAKFFPDTDSQNINAIITLFSTRPSGNIEVSIADKDMTTNPTKKILARQRSKWGHVIAMPGFFREIFDDLHSRSRYDTSRMRIGQGLNFPKRDLDVEGARIPVILKMASFFTTSAEGLVASVPIGREVPALIMPRGIGERYYCSYNDHRAFSYSAVEVYLPPELWATPLHYGLWAYMNSSFVWLYREITGRKNLGGGMLKAEATDLKALPLGFDFSALSDASAVMDDIKTREPLPVHKAAYPATHAD